MYQKKLSNAEVHIYI